MLAHRALMRLEPEIAHRMALWGLQRGLVRGAKGPDYPDLEMEVMGLRFRNPLGLAAGFDKDGVAVLPLMRLGFGLVEVGSVTMHGRAGNPRPRLFRLDVDQGIVNRMGLPSDGLAVVKDRLARLRRQTLPAVLGVNLASTLGGASEGDELAAMAESVAPLADYIALNFSCLNVIPTEGRLATRIADAVHAVRTATWIQRKPVLVKVGPDLEREEMGEVVEAAVAGGAAGMIIGNSSAMGRLTLDRRQPGWDERGALSGQPLFGLSTRALAWAWMAARGRLVLIGCGGVDGADAALKKMLAGASLVQMHSGLVFGGPRAPRQAVERMAAKLWMASVLAQKKTALDLEPGLQVRELVGKRAEKWADGHGGSGD